MEKSVAINEVFSNNLGVRHNGITTKHVNQSEDIINENADKARIESSAKDFEASFIVQMLKDAGFDKALVQGIGSAGEAYSSFILQAYADRISNNGGFGLASAIEAQLSKQNIHQEISHDKK